MISPTACGTLVEPWWNAGGTLQLLRKREQITPRILAERPGPSLPPVLLRMPPCKAKLRVTAQSRPDRGPTAQSGPDRGPTAQSGPDRGPTEQSGPDRGPTVNWCPIGARRCNRPPIVPWCNPSHPKLSAGVSIAKLGDASLVQLTGPDGAIGDRGPTVQSGPDRPVVQPQPPILASIAKLGDASLVQLTGPD